MPANVSLQASMGLAITFVALALGTWRWQSHVAHLQQDNASVSDSWAHVQHDYPMVPEAPEASTLSGEIVEGVVRANPFSPRRRFVPSATGGGDTEYGGTAIESTKPVFTYKGRINVGQRQRAIMEETESGKTYFLEVGQEVAGFKVLDIAENQVVLSDTKTNEEVVVFLISPEGR